jgi:hypothetical protein
MFLFQTQPWYNWLMLLAVFALIANVVAVGYLAPQVMKTRRNPYTAEVAR